MQLFQVLHEYNYKQGEFLPRLKKVGYIISSSFLFTEVFSFFIYYFNIVNAATIIAGIGGSTGGGLSLHLLCDQ